ncbi:AI-2E family transporter [Salidesulfovibrio onnuriiensis]|uniref:AI-2E family transporter n=1 Tax=Salidesulfovibrio onnuriiensis TaxID=2583823 RepID=UPI0011C9D614|nr:AI-2E family transporter [Salidesulfovibrio onnuriiensis]
MFDSDRPYTFDRVVRLALAAALLWAGVSLAGYLSEALLPFAAALVLAYMINPLVELTQKLIKSRPAAVVLTLLLVTAALVGLIWVLVPVIASELSHMGSTLSELVNNSALAQKAADRLPPDLWQAIRDLAKNEDVRRFFSETGLSEMLQAGAKKALPGMWKIISGTANILLALAGLVVVGLYLSFILLDFGKFRDNWQEYIPGKYRQTVVDFFEEFTTAMNRYFRTQALIALIMGVLFSLGFSLIGLPLAVVLGMFTGLLNLVPYLQIAGLIPAFALAGVDAVIHGHSLWYGFALVGGVFAVAQLTQDAVLVPRLQGKAMGLSPWLILLSLSVWGQLLGFLGLIIALPMTVLCLAYYRRFLKQSPAQGYKG